MALEAHYHKQKEYKRVQALGFGLVIIIKFLGSVFSASSLVKHQNSVPHLDISKTQRNSHRLQGRTPASVSEEQMEKEVSQDPLSHILVLRTHLCRYFARSGSHCTLCYIKSPSQAGGSGDRVMQKWNGGATGNVTSDKLSLWA